MHCVGAESVARGGDTCRCRCGEFTDEETELTCAICVLLTKVETDFTV
jgi:hypothetical protein